MTKREAMAKIYARMADLEGTMPYSEFRKKVIDSFKEELGMHDLHPGTLGDHYATARRAVLHTPVRYYHRSERTVAKSAEKHQEEKETNNKLNSLMRGW